MKPRHPILIEPGVVYEWTIAHDDSLVGYWTGWQSEWGEIRLVEDHIGTIHSISTDRVTQVRKPYGDISPITI